MFFYEQMNPMGIWSPCTAPEPPEHRTADGRKLKIRACRAVAPTFLKLNLKQLWAVYSPDGPFYLCNLNQGVQNERHEHH